MIHFFITVCWMSNFIFCLKTQELTIIMNIVYLCRIKLLLVLKWLNQRGCIIDTLPIYSVWYCCQVSDMTERSSLIFMFILHFPLWLMDYLSLSGFNMHILWGNLKGVWLSHWSFHIPSLNWRAWTISYRWVSNCAS